ncbi:hypothetical protein ACFLTO_02670 [Chloroflexota bacterium]
MKIDKAIGLLEPLTNQDVCDLDVSEMSAIRLGIEALKCIKEHRAELGNLPSETEE